jgi:hypothetical protein
MSIFSAILEKLGLQKPAAKPRATAPTPKPVAGTGAHSGPVGMPAPVATPRPAPIAMVDVVSKLENLAGETPGLDWKVSIVDLMKLLGIDSSLSARKELATELGCPADLMGGDYAKMNVWLHETVLKKIAENGGNIPASLLKK